MRVAGWVLRRWGDPAMTLEWTHHRVQMVFADIMNMVHAQVRKAEEISGRRARWLVLNPEDTLALCRHDGVIANSWSVRLDPPWAPTLIAGLTVVNCPWYSGDPLVLVEPDDDK